MGNNSIPIWVFIALFAFIMSGSIGPLFGIFIFYMIARYGFMNQRNRQQQHDPRQSQRPSSRRQTRSESEARRDWEYRRQQERTANVRKTKPKENPFKKSGIEKYKDYDFDGAIADFNKALAIDSSDIAVHFNLACAYSINEAPDKAFFHISKAVENGFSDVEKINTHDALAYLRIQPEFENFAKNGYKLGGTTVQTEKKSTENADLLEQLNKLAELREKGLLTEEEFAQQKRKLLG